MARIIRGTNGNDRINQNGRFDLEIYGLGGNDTIVLDRDDDLGGDNFVDAGTGNDTVFNAFEGGNRILLGKGNDIYIGTGFSSLGGFDIVEGRGGNDQFFLTTLKSAYLGGGGKDIFNSEGWENGFDGGAGSDTISYQFRHESTVIGDTGVIIDLAAGLVQTGASRTEQIISIENAVGSRNADIIGGTDDDNTLMGLAGTDTIFGFGGDDVIVGGAGFDAMLGDTGSDVFVFQAVTDSLAGFRDKIGDFTRAEGDRIDLSAIDAITGGGDQAFTFQGIASFTGQAGELRFASGVLSADVNGDGQADFAVSVDGLTSMTATDFVL
ncbi:calcium-binding protein [Rhizobium sp. LjRoot254]|uniref:calcium-binding protein n=1 Tax=Rhizobium sp. LjRoot254 TaxID=3342297 RepID=UPI003ECE2CBD